MCGLKDGEAGPQQAGPGAPARRGTGGTGGRAACAPSGEPPPRLLRGTAAGAWARPGADGPTRCGVRANVGLAS